MVNSEVYKEYIDKANYHTNMAKQVKNIYNSINELQKKQINNNPMYEVIKQDLMALFNHYRNQAEISYELARQILVEDTMKR